jgi:transcription antitermination factor NusG
LIVESRFGEDSRCVQETENVRDSSRFARSMSTRFRIRLVTNKYEFLKGEPVRIKVGVFRGFIAKVSEVHKMKGTLKVTVEVFGKPQPVELRFLEVEKIDRETSTD